jgi:hypothetical protein
MLYNITQSLAVNASLELVACQRSLPPNRSLESSDPTPTSST